MNNILVIKLRYIGDVLLATPVIRALRERFPEARITAAVNRGTEAVLRQNQDLNEVLVVERGGLGKQVKFVGELRRRHFDCVVDLTDGDRSAILAWLSGAPVRIGFNDEHRWRGLLYTSLAEVRREAVHRLEHDLEAVRVLGIEPQDKSIPLVFGTSRQDDEEAAGILKDVFSEGEDHKDPRPLVMLQPGARYWFKAWPVERFAELADRLAEVYGCRVLIGGDTREQGLAETLRSKAGSAPAVLAGRTTLLQYAAVLKRCALFVGNDNGPMHMAAALGVPVVALFGPSDPREWGPRGKQTRVLYQGLDCRSCFHPTCTRGEGSCMKQITVDDVFEAVKRMSVLKEPVRERA